jgi:hypothetical protein
MLKRSLQCFQNELKYFKIIEIALRTILNDYKCFKNN